MRTAIIIKYGYWWKYEVGIWRLLEFGKLPMVLSEDIIRK